VTTDLHLINDSWHDAKIHVDLFLSRQCPEFIPEAECFDSPVAKWSFDFTPKADSIEKVPVTWKLPDEEGCYWLTARMTGVAGRPVLSQRFVRAIKPPVVSSSLKQRTFVVLGTGDSARAFFKLKGLRTSDRLGELSPKEHVVVIWNATHLTERERQHAKALCDFARDGGRIVVLATPSWDWWELCDVKIVHHPRFSRVFPCKGLKNPLLEGIDPNGSFDGTACPAQSPSDRWKALS